MLRHQTAEELRLSFITLAISEKNRHLHGSPEAWDEVFTGLDLSYSEEASSQNKLFELVKIDFLKNIFPPAPAKMLEVGCGTAFVSLYFAKRGYEVACLDINESILKEAKANFKKESQKGKFVVGDAEALPFPDNQFDIVTSFGLLEHFEKPQKAIAEMVRVVKPRGIVFVDVVPDRFSCQTFGNIFNAAASFLYWSARGKPFVGLEKAKRNFRPLYFENSLSWKEYREIMKRAELNKVQARGNRPFPRLSLPRILDRFYSNLLKLTIPAWKAFDKWDSPIPRLWGAGWWFWGYKILVIFFLHMLY